MANKCDSCKKDCDTLSVPEDGTDKVVKVIVEECSNYEKK